MDIIDNHIPPKAQRNYLAESLILIGTVVVSTIVFGFIGIAFTIIAFDLSFLDIQKFASGEVLTAQAATVLKINQAFSMIGMFIGSIIFLLTTRRKIFSFISFTGEINILRILSSVVLVFVALPLVSYLVNINTEIAKSLGYTSKDLMGIYELLGSSDNTLGFVLSILVMAVLPAIAEEFLFRGLVQKILIQWTKHNHISIAITSFIFAFIHGNPEQVLGIFILGMVLGYLMEYTANLLFPILLHFTNNLVSLIAMNYQQEDSSILASDYQPSITIAAVSLSVLLGIFYYLNKTKSISSFE